MNGAMIRYILGYVLKIEAVLMLVPCITSLCYREHEGIFFLGTGAAAFLLGVLMTLKKPEKTVFYLKDGCVATSLSWIFLSVFGALPFVLTGEIPNVINALFETVSGFTTTGASILANVEGLSHTALIWRSFTHWIGGMGVLVFLLAIIPLSGGSNINLMRAESPGPSVGKFYPKVKNTARILYMIYIGMTAVMFLLLLAGHMPVFDAICTSVGTAGTGGFGIKNESLASYSPYIQWVTAVFMVLFSVNFNAYYYIIYRQFKKAFQMEEVKYYLLIILAASLFIMGNILCTMDIRGGVFDALTQSVFQVTSVISSTGFSSVDFNLWPAASKTVLVLLMFIGACAGSTGGGIKISRIIILLKTMIKELQSYLHPKSIVKINMEKKPVEHEVIRSTNVYFITFMLLFAISVFLVSLEGKDLVTNFTAVIATLNNIGPGLSKVGPAGNFDGLGSFSKCVLIFDMLAGRLELFPILLLFHPVLWKETLLAKRTAWRRKGRG